MLHFSMLIKPAMINATLKNDGPGFFFNQVNGKEIVWSQFVYIDARVPE